MIDLEVVRETGLALVTMNRPAKLNALTVGMWKDLAGVFQQLSSDDAVRVVVIAGAGERAFCVGADIGEFETTRATRDQALEYAELVRTTVSAIHDCPHPTIAAVRGHCVGGGVEIAAMCDMRIASRSSRFGIPIRRLGLTVDYPELHALSRLVGPSNALEILFEGRVFGAEEALAKGLVNRVVVDEDLSREVDAAAERIATGAPLVARWHKRMMRRIEDPRPLSEEERLAPFAVFDSEDYRIGTNAFLAKRDPVFTGR